MNESLIKFTFTHLPALYWTITGLVLIGGVGLMTSVLRRKPLNRL